MTSSEKPDDQGNGGNGAQERRGVAAQIGRCPGPRDTMLGGAKGTSPYGPWELYLSQPAPSAAS
ncbi:hypothetical protein GCM10010260_81280 [Streptomyces filipinensis]|uniref:Uncharacterized protein n=1 Tax=Streptomyces filipinensis TaxID=66887 RepID=A0A918IJQ2_9ACTN|nr:hypothetical protein GCM10010260_81280 [Streptomyces filipinensis]